MIRGRKVGLEDLLPITEKVVNQAGHVFINNDSVRVLASLIPEFSDDFSNSIKIKGDSLKVDLQLIFVRNAINYSFWPDFQEPKWMVEYTRNGYRYTNGGYDGLEACFDRAFLNDTKILSPNFLTHITEAQTKFFLRGIGGREIPMIHERTLCLKNVGQVLLGKFRGRFLNVVEESNYDAVQLVNLIAENFSSYNDIARFRSMRIPFFKRAQLCVRDTDIVLRHYGENGLKNIDKLTAFADYKIPQILREFNVLEYSEQLKQVVQEKRPILRDDPMEVEIRSSTVQAVERIRCLCSGSHTSTQIDAMLWKMTQEWDLKEPYHKTRTFFY